MKAIYGGKANECITGPLGVGLGNFDGLHIGHMALINILINESRLYGLSSMVYTFTKHPENILRKKFLTPLITSEGKKIKLLEETSLDYLFFDEFDEEFSRMGPETFARDILANKLKTRLAVAGFDYRFGFKGQGDAGLLKELGLKYGFKVIIIPPVRIGGEIVSSTLVRDYIKKGDMDKVFGFLGRHYSIEGKVVEGRHVGKDIGFPTANIRPENYLVMPREGVYITRVMLDGVQYPGVTNVGRNPTFNEERPISVETHILDFDKDIYDRNIEVFFLRRIRDEKKFKGKDELKRQISNDAAAARRYFETVK